VSKDCQPWRQAEISSMPTSATHAAAMYVGFPPWGLGHLEVLGGKSRTARGSQARASPVPLYVGANSPAPCTWTSRSNLRRFNQRLPTWALAPCLSVYPFFSNQFPIDRFVLIKTSPALLVRYTTLMHELLTVRLFWPSELASS
jgi:hypothetical protein